MTVMYMAVARAVMSCTMGVRQNTAGSSCHTTTAGTMRRSGAQRVVVEEQVVPLNVSMRGELHCQRHEHAAAYGIRRPRQQRRHHYHDCGGGHAGPGLAQPHGGKPCFKQIYESFHSKMAF